MAMKEGGHGKTGLSKTIHSVPPISEGELGTPFGEAERKSAAARATKGNKRPYSNDGSR